MDGNYCRASFRVHCPTQLGQTVAISGSSFALGHFDKTKVIHLVTTPESFPVWYTQEPVLIPRVQKVSYKYCIVECGKVACMEKNDDRFFSLDDLDIVVEDRFDQVDIEGFATSFDVNLLSEISAAAAGTTATVESLSSTKEDRLVLVCYHLPVKIFRTSNPTEPFSVHWAESLIAKTKGSVSASRPTFWFGTIFIPGEAPTQSELDCLVAKLKTMNCFPIFIDKDVARLAYHGYCKQILWPTFHNVDPLDHIHAAWHTGGLGSPNPGSSSGSNITGTLAGQTSSIPSSSRDDGMALDWSQNATKTLSAYRDVNAAFFQALQPFLDKGDIVWVHDYHLMLLPSQLRERNNADISIVFFLHIPFPTSQLFRTVPSGPDLLHSMTCADVVGFHSFDHARHFLNTTKRILGIRSYTSQGGMLSLKVKDREVIVTMSHVSVEPEVIDAALADPKTLELAAAIRAKYPNKKLIVGVDVCQRLSGGALKMAAFEKLLTDYAGDCSDSVVLLQKSLRPGARMDDEATTSADLMKMVTDLNNRFGRPAANGSAPNFVVDYEEMKSISLSERVALWLAADVFLLTSIKEGLNLFPLEYIYSRKNLENAGVVVASEFTACSSLLSGSLKVNPFYTLHVADTLHKAISMPPIECAQRMQRDLPFVANHPSAMWTKDIINDLQYLREAGELSRRARDMSVSTSQPLDMPPLLDAYVGAAHDGLTQIGRRLLIFDYGGTLLHKEKFDIYIKQTLSAISGRPPTTRMMSAIKALSDDPNNIVMVMTGLTKMKLGDVFAGLRNVTLVTSNGLVYSWGENMLSAEEKAAAAAAAASTVISSVSMATDDAPHASLSWDEKKRMGLLPPSSDLLSSGDVRGGRDANGDFRPVPVNDEIFASVLHDPERQWNCLDFGIDWVAVRNIAIPIITKFTSRTNGTCQTPRIPGIGWSYFGADPEWGDLQAKQLQVELEAALAKHDVKVVSQIQGSIEVVPRSLNKGVVVKTLLRRITEKRAGRLPSFVLIMGDEPSDDAMFHSFFDFAKDLKSPVAAGLDVCRAFTVTVGKYESAASFYLQDVKHVEDVLSGIISHASASSSGGQRKDSDSMKLQVDGVMAY